MRRLKKLSTMPGELDYVEVELEHSDAEDMIELKELDAAQVKTELHCIECGYEPLKTQEGIIYCQKCGTSYKVFQNKVFEII